MDYIFSPFSFLILEKDNYHIVCTSPTTLLISRKSVIPHIYGNCPPNFKGPPQFCSVHKISLKDGILTCSCGFKNRFGIPCRHLFCIEPNYNTEDIHCRWQKAYSIYCYSEGCRDVTQVYKKIIAFQHWGISVKEGNKNFISFPRGLINCSVFPTVISSVDDSNDSDVLDETMHIYNSPIPVCWNYSFHEYPPEYQKRVSQDVVEKMSYSQEFCDNSFDSDGENNVNSYKVTISSINTKQNLIASDAMIVNKLREILPYFTSKEDKLKLYNILVESGNQMFSEKFQKFVMT